MAIKKPPAEIALLQFLQEVIQKFLQNGLY